MSVMDNCDVFLSDGDVLNNVPVLFRDSGWIRVTHEKGQYTYFPPHMVDEVFYERNRGDENENRD